MGQTNSESLNYLWNLKLRYDIKRQDSRTYCDFLLPVTEEMESVKTDNTATTGLQDMKRADEGQIRNFKLSEGDMLQQTKDLEEENGEMKGQICK